MATPSEAGVPVLSRGAHASPREGACVMEYVSVLAGEEFSDHPCCTDPLLAHVARQVNDATSPGARGELARLAPELIGTAGVDARVREAVVQRCVRVARSRGRARWPWGRIPVLSRGRTGHKRSIERAVAALCRLPGDGERDAALYHLLATAAATCQPPASAHWQHPGRSQPRRPLAAGHFRDG